MSGLIDILEEEALEQVKELRAYRTYRGTDQDRFRRARVALGVVGSYVRLRATLANEQTNQLVAERMTREIGPAIPAIEGKRLTD